jgi:hypothetical protein
MPYRGHASDAFRAVARQSTAERWAGEGEVPRINLAASQSTQLAQKYFQLWSSPIGAIPIVGTLDLLTQTRAPTMAYSSIIEFVLIGPSGDDDESHDAVRCEPFEVRLWHQNLRLFNTVDDISKYGVLPFYYQQLGSFCYAEVDFDNGDLCCMALLPVVRCRKRIVEDSNFAHQDGSQEELIATALRHREEARLHLTQVGSLVRLCDRDGTFPPAIARIKAVAPLLSLPPPGLLDRGERQEYTVGQPQTLAYALALSEAVAVEPSAAPDRGDLSGATELSFVAAG